MIDLTPALRKKYENPWSNKIGRYSVSAIYDIVNGYLTVNTFFDPPKFSLPSMWAMWKGKWDHEKIQDLLKELGYENEIKKEITYNDWTLVGKADSVKPDHILEIKTSKNIIKKLSPKYEMQGKLYCSIFSKPYTDFVQPVLKKNTLFLQSFGKTTRDDDWMDEILQKVDVFHNQLIEKYKK